MDYNSTGGVFPKNARDGDTLKTLVRMG